MEIGIEPTARHAADLGIIPVVIEDACGAGHVDAAQRSCQALHFAGAAIMTDTEAFCAALGKASGAQAKQTISGESDSARLD
ncbi:MAG TPA: isochorismatase family protein, partial [Bradyrhizobium sp.]|nr:isochorismatase family protein [Bradyrhizobium sp.]